MWSIVHGPTQGVAIRSFPGNYGNSYLFTWCLWCKIERETKPPRRGENKMSGVLIGLVDAAFDAAAIQVAAAGPGFSLDFLSVYPKTY
jgi:hypothetical protein